MANVNIPIKDAGLVNQNIRMVQHGDNSLSATQVISDPTSGVQAKVDAQGSQQLILKDSTGANTAAVTADGEQKAIVTLADPSSGLEVGITPEAAMKVNAEGGRAAYRYSGSAIAPGATPTDFLLIQGSDTKVLRVKLIELSAIAGTAGGLPAILNRYTGAPAGGTPVTVTAAKHDTNDGAPTAVVKHYTAAPTAGTGPTQLGAKRLYCPLVADGPIHPIRWVFGNRNDKPLVLRGLTDYVAVNFAGAALPGSAVISYEIEIEESTS